MAIKFMLIIIIIIENFAAKLQACSMLSLNPEVQIN